MEASTMSTNSIRLIEIPVEGNGGLVWNRLHSEREDICEALVKEEFLPGSETQPGPQGMSNDAAMHDTNWHRELLQARLRKIDDALDRLMSGSYGNCSKCGKWIEDTKLEFDPAIAFCLGCWEREQHRPGTNRLSGGSQNKPQRVLDCDLLDHSTETDSSRASLALQTLAPFDTICVQTLNSEYRIFLLDPGMGRALVEGGRHFVEPVEAMICGSVSRDSTIKSGEIAIGLRLEMWAGGKPVSTSPVQSFHVEQLATTERASLCGR